MFRISKSLDTQGGLLVAKGGKGENWKCSFFWDDVNVRFGATEWAGDDGYTALQKSMNHTLSK